MVVATVSLLNCHTATCATHNAVNHSGGLCVPVSEPVLREESRLFPWTGAGNGVDGHWHSNYWENGQMGIASEAKRMR